MAASCTLFTPTSLPPYSKPFRRSALRLFCASTPAPEQKPSRQRTSRKSDAAAPRGQRKQVKPATTAEEEQIETFQQLTTSTAAPPAARKLRTRKQQQEEQQQQVVRQGSGASIDSQTPAAAAPAPATGRPAGTAAKPTAPWAHYDQSQEFQQYKKRTQQLKDFFDRHNRLPSGSKSAEMAETKLAWWLQEQRSGFHAGKLHPAKLQHLTDTMGSTDWQQQLRTNLDFDDMVGRLKKWVAEHDSELPQQLAVDEDGIKVGIWVKRRRAEYSEGTLSAERIAALESIPGWVWAAGGGRKGKVSFEDSLEILKAYVEEHGQMPSNITEGDDERLNLGSWAKQQRLSRRKGKLSTAKVQALEQVTGWYWDKVRQ